MTSIKYYNTVKRTGYQPNRRPWASLLHDGQATSYMRRELFRRLLSSVHELDGYPESENEKERK